MWCLDKQELSEKDFRAFLSHINFISHRACDDHYRDNAHVDLAIKKIAEVEGFAAFLEKFRGGEHYTLWDAELPTMQIRQLNVNGSQEEVTIRPSKTRMLHMELGLRMLEE